MAPAAGEAVPSEAELVRTLKGHVTTVTSLAFSPSALLLMTGCCKGWMNIWALQVSIAPFTFPRLIFVFIRRSIYHSFQHFVPHLLHY